MKKYWIRPVPLWRADREGSIHTYMYNFGKPSGTCIYSWYIEGSEPKVVVDTGCQADLITARGATAEHMQYLEEGYNKKLGISTKDIDIVIFTHLSGDHAALSDQFTKAKFIVQKKELESFLHPHPYISKSGFYDPDWLKDRDIEAIEGDKEIIEGVRVIYTPGHTLGGQSVAIDTPKGTAVITGFCCTFKNFNPPPQAKARGIDFIPSGRHIDVLKAYDSMEKIIKTGYTIIPNHDPSFIGADRLPL